MATIRYGTAAAIRNFQELSAALSSSNAIFSHLIDSQGLEDEFGRLRVWSGNLGALQKGHSSLDYRLRDSPLLSSNTLKLLKELEDNLSEAIAIVSGTRLPYEQQARVPKPEEDDGDDFYSEDEDDDNESGVRTTELEQRFCEIVDIIDNLYKLSVRIRQPTLRTRSLKAASYQPKDPETGIDLLEQYANFDLQHTKELVGHLRAPHINGIKIENDVLVDRLSRAITLRRRQFKYWRRHRDKLGVSSLLQEGSHDLPGEFQRPSELQRHDTVEAQAGKPAATALVAVASEKTGRTLLSGTEATHHHQSLDDIVDSKSVTSYATTVRDLTGKGIDLPPPPIVANGEKDFECPYCFIICPARYGKGRAWRTHLLQDLQPYVCTYADCESSEQLFRSRREWSEHESSHRKAWRCPEHPAAVYRTQTGLEDHLRREHSDSFPEHQLHSIAKVGETSTVDVRAECPICFAPADMEEIGALQNHIANHLERLASFSLPVAATDDDLDGASGVASRGGSATTESSPGSSNSQSKASIYSSISRSNEIPGAVAGSSASLQRLQSSMDLELPPPGHLLSIETLGNVPDSSQKRMDILLSSNRNDDEFDDSDEQSVGDEVRLAEIEPVRAYMLSLPGAQSVRFLRRLGWWRGYTNFEDEASAIKALGSFNHSKIPDVKVRLGKENRLAIKFSLPTKERVAPQPSYQSTSEEEDSISSASVSNDEGPENNIRPPILESSEIPTLRSLYRSGQLLQRDQSYAPNDAYNQIISFCRYDMTRLKVDAIVNSANRSMEDIRPNDSLNHYIHKAAGPGLRRECKAAGGRVKAGAVRLTSGCDLPSSYVIHAARPDYSGRGLGKLNILTQCYRAALKMAISHGIKTIAFPCLAAGACGFPSRVAARIALQEVREFLDVYQGHRFERIIFCVFIDSDEKAYKDFLPVFFPPTHGDLENAVIIDQNASHASVISQLHESHTQVGAIAQELHEFSDNMLSDFPSDVFSEAAAISSALRSLTDRFETPKESVPKLTDRVREDIDLLSAVLTDMSGSVTEIVEQTTYTRNFGQPSHKAIWDDYNFHMKNSRGLDFQALLVLCQSFVQCLVHILVSDGLETPEMNRMRLELGTYHARQTGQGRKGVRDHFDEVMFAREFQKEENIQSRYESNIKVHQIPTIARLYQLGELEYRPTYAKPDSKQLHTVCLLREDITRLEVDVIVNSTDPHFAGMGTLDRTIFRKGGLSMQEDISKLGKCEEGDIKVTQGYLLPARHVIHTIPPETLRSNTKDVLRKQYRDILFMASSLKATSVAIPSIGTGMLNYPKRDSASLAMEEVKRFLETMGANSTIEKIIFCVFGSNDEFIYKSLLPTFFPPMDSNANRALPSYSIPQVPHTGQGTAIAPTTAETPAPRRNLFDSIGEAFRNVRFGKQPVTELTRSLQPGEEDALINFEIHCQSCPICNDIVKLYNDGQRLCPHGYAAGQFVLRYLYMEASQLVYSTRLEGGKRVRVEMPNSYPNAWNLLVHVEKSSRHGDGSRLFVSPNQPYAAAVEEPLETLPPGVNVYNAEVTIPRRLSSIEAVPDQNERSQMGSSATPDVAQALIMLFSWNEVKLEWRKVYPSECVLKVHPGKLQVYELDAQTAIDEQPLLSMRISSLTPVGRYGDMNGARDVTVRAEPHPESRIKVESNVMFRCRTTDEAIQLSRAISNARRHKSRQFTNPSSQESQETQAKERDEPVDLVLPSAPSHDLTSAKSGVKSALTEQLRASQGSLSLPDSSSELPKNIVSRTTLNLAQQLLSLLEKYSQPGMSGLSQHEIAKRLDIPLSKETEIEQYLKDLNLVRMTTDGNIQSIPETANTTAELLDQRSEHRAKERRLSGDMTPRIDLSTSGLSTVNIDDYFTYLDLAIDPAHPESSQSTEPQQHQPLTRAMTLDTFGRSSKSGPDTPRAHSGRQGTEAIKRRQEQEDYELAQSLVRDENSKQIDLELERAEVLERKRAQQSEPQRAMRPNDLNAPGKRVGRKRLPPLVPGAALQFEVASHPDDFRADIIEQKRLLAEEQAQIERDREHAEQLARQELQSDVPLPTDNTDNESARPHHPRPSPPDHPQDKAIPAGARWTKIDRRLVNAQSLEESNERFEQHEDYIIVMRVLTRTEIMRFAERTRYIRRGRVELQEFAKQTLEGEEEKTRWRVVD